MSRRLRGGLFVLLAAVCAVASASVAAGYRDSVDSQIGELRPVVVVAEPLEPGPPLDRKQVRRSLELRDLPLRYLPPDALADPGEALGRRLHSPVPAGSYLLGSHLRTAAAPAGRGPSLAGGKRPVDVTVRGGAALRVGPASSRGRVDVVVAEEAGAGGRPRVRVAAHGVRLLALAEQPADEGATPGAWTATLALSRRQALELIEAENFAREIRLIPRP